MEFILPDNLKKQLISYDPVLKKLAKTENAAGQTRKRSTHPLGNVEDIIPADVVSPADLQAAIKSINAEAAPQRYHIFPETNSLKYAILYHFESVWVAAWLPVEQTEYIYGFSIAFKDTSKASDLHSSLGLHRPDVALPTIEVKQYGRSFFRTATVFVTREDIEEGRYLHHYWNIGMRVCRFSRKSQNIWNCINSFYEKLAASIPHWEDGRNIWERIYVRHNAYRSILNLQNNTVDEWIPSADTAIQYFTEEYRHYLWKDEDYRGRDPGRDKVRSILSTPFFRKWLQEQCDSIIAKFHDPECTVKAHVIVGWNKIDILVRWIANVVHVWPDVPVDHLRNNVDVFLQVSPINETTKLLTDRSLEWVRTHMPVESFMMIIQKHHANFKESLEHNAKFHPNDVSRYWSKDIQEHVAPPIYNLRDTFQMIKVIIEAGEHLDPPKRWRIAEFHDHVQTEAWKINNPNIALPQDLFPAPIKIELGKESWSFFQPLDTHQLASWGRAVRNCVGSASTYAEGIKKKQHFIVLCMVDNKPRFTIQLKVKNGLMSVEQITDVNNARLTLDDRSLYTEAFGQALAKRNECATV